MLNIAPSARAGRPRLFLSPLGAAALIAFAASSAVRAQEAATPAATNAATAATASTAEQTLPAVKVTASHDSGQHLDETVSSGALGSRSQLDTPFSTTVVTAEELADRQVSKLGEVFALDASVSDNSDANSSWSSYLTVRGLQLDWQNGFKIDGMPFVGYGITLPYEQFEKIELLKGLSGFMYGFGSPGGVVNYVTKKPTATPVRSVDIGYRSNGVFAEHADLGGRFGPAQMFGYRLNATHEEGKTYNDGNLKRDSVSVALDARITRELTATFGAMYQERRTTGQTPSISTASYRDASLPSAISGGSGDLSGPDQHLYTNFQLYTGGLRYQLNPDWAASITYSYSRASRSRNESTLNLIDSSGSYTDLRYDGSQSHTFSQWQAMVEGQVNTGPFRHQVVFGAAWQRQTNNYGTNDFYGLIGTGNIYQANTNTYYSSIPFQTYRDSDITQKTLFASDTIKLTERWSVLGGVRFTNYEQNSYNTANVTTSSYGKNGVTTPTIALMYKLDPATTLYASYVESLEQGALVGTDYANSGALLNPLRSKQYEAGVKTERARWSATAAVFRIERGASYANSDNVFVQDGESVFQGLEAGAGVRLGSQWEVGGNLMWLDSEYKKGSAYQGNRVAGAPSFVAAGHVTYAVPFVPGLRVGADAKFTGNTMVRPANDLKTTSYTLVNVGANYSTQIGGYDVTLRAALNNLTNRRYWEFQYADYVKPGDPRSISLNARIDF